MRPQSFIAVAFKFSELDGERGFAEPPLHEKLPLTIFDSHPKCSQSWTTIFDTRINGVGALLTLDTTLTRVKVNMPLIRVKGEQRYL